MLTGPTNGDVLLISNNTAGGLKPSGTQQSKWEGLAMISATQILADAEETVHTVENVITGATSVGQATKKCTFQFDKTIAAGNKGIEEIFVWTAANGTRYMMGICEGPGCAATTLTSATNVWPPNNAVFGKIMVFNQNPSTCAWANHMNITTPAKMGDYAAFSFFPAYPLPNNNGTKDIRVVSILSQQDSMVWVGRFDFNTMSFISTGSFYRNLPRTAGTCTATKPGGTITNCNMEGIAWINSTHLIAVSDQADCGSTQESVHIFDLQLTAGTGRKASSRKMLLKQ